MSRHRDNFRYFIVLFVNALCVRVVVGMPALRRTEENQVVSRYGAHVIYVSPVPGSSYLTPSTAIIVRSDQTVNPASIRKAGLLEVDGSSSGSHAGSVTLADDQRTIIFQSKTPFALGERVSVFMTYPIMSASGDTIDLDPFSFTISRNDLDVGAPFNSRLSNLFPNAGSKYYPGPSPDISGNGQSQTMTAPPPNTPSPAFPPLTVTASDSPSPGYIFLATNVQPNSYGNYLIIADNEGDPVFYRNLGRQVPFDFTLQPTGVLTYCAGTGNSNIFYVMNTSLNIIDSIQATNGYQTNNHELQILPNGNTLLLANDYEQIDMSKIVPGGDTSATVVEEVIQEFDKDGNLIFQWRTIDHFKITDAIGQDLTASSIDPFHANAISVDPDGTILLSCRHTSEITKIDPQTGDIIWRLGGKNNEFNFLNDPIGFSYQHDVRRLANGNITLMDNGNLQNPQFSRAAEYKLDESNKTATLVWQFRHDPDAYNPYMGNVQRLPDGNTLIGWGGAHTPAVTEVRPDGTTALEMTFPNQDSLALSYRAFRFPFLFVTSPTASDTIEAGEPVTLKWNSSGIDSVDIDYSTDGGGTWTAAALNYPGDADSLSLQVPAMSGGAIQFRIIQSGSIDRGMTYCSNTMAVAGQLAGILPQTSPYSYSLLDNFPNPFNPTTEIGYRIAATSHVTLKVYNVLGRTVATLVDRTQAPGTYEVKFAGNRLASGVYFYRLEANGFTSTKKMVMMK